MDLYLLLQQCAWSLLALCASQRLINASTCCICRSCVWGDRRAFVWQVTAATITAVAVNGDPEGVQVLLVVVLCGFAGLLLLQDDLWHLETRVRCETCGVSMCSTCILHAVESGGFPMRCACGLRGGYGALEVVAPPRTARALKMFMLRVQP